MRMTHVGALKLHCLPTRCIKVCSPLETVLRAVLRSQLPGVSIPYTVERVEQAGEASIDAKHEFKAKSQWEAPWQFLIIGTKRQFFNKAHLTSHSSWVSATRCCGDIIRTPNPIEPRRVLNPQLPLPKQNRDERYRYARLARGSIVR